MGLKKRFGLRIKELRTKNKLTQAQLSELVGIATKTQGFIETGRSFPEVNTIEKYAEVFKMDLSDVLNISHINNDTDTLSQIKSMLNDASEEQIVIVYKFLKSLLY